MKDTKNQEITVDQLNFWKSLRSSILKTPSIVIFIKDCVSIILN